MWAAVTTPPGTLQVSLRGQLPAQRGGNRPDHEDRDHRESSVGSSASDSAAEVPAFSCMNAPARSSLCRRSAIRSRGGLRAGDSHRLVDIVAPSITLRDHHRPAGSTARSTAPVMLSRAAGRLSGTVLGARLCPRRLGAAITVRPSSTGASQCHYILVQRHTRKADPLNAIDWDRIGIDKFERNSRHPCRSHMERPRERSLALMKVRRRRYRYRSTTRRPAAHLPAEVPAVVVADPGHPSDQHGGCVEPLSRLRDRRGSVQEVDSDNERMRRYCDTTSPHARGDESLPVGGVMASRGLGPWARVPHGSAVRASATSPEVGP